MKLSLSQISLPIPVSYGFSKNLLSLKRYFFFPKTMMMMMMIMMSVSVESSFPVLVMGDWGGKDKHPYTTKEEVATAKGMKHFAEKNGANTTIVLGDNFYDKGVKSVDDSRFKTTFEDVFDKDVLTDFRVLAGNHDHNGNVG